jgi:hypothetical protein
MSDMYGSLLTSAFRVKDRTSFLRALGIDPKTFKEQGELNEWNKEGYFYLFEIEAGYFCFRSNGMYPGFDVEYIHYRDDEDDEGQEVQIALHNLIKDHIHPEDKCVGTCVAIRTDDNEIYYQRITVTSEKATFSHNDASVWKRLKAKKGRCTDG